jgi:putative ABC transport system permease protein
MQFRNGKYINAGINSIDTDLQKTLNLKIHKGRFFSHEFPSDLKTGVLINESAKNVLDIAEPVGEKIFISQSSDSKDLFEIIGVVKDFHTESLHKAVRPYILMYTPNGHFMYVRLKPENISQSIQFIEEKVHELIPNEPFTFQFLDETINDLYRSEKLMSKLILYVTILAIFISSLGLLGLITFMAVQRTKEIGIRKVLGASVVSVVLMLTKDFVKWIITANLIALPIAYYMMSIWLQDFAYRIEITWWIFALAGGIALLIALATVSIQAIKAATANPVDSLKYE